MNRLLEMTRLKDILDDAALASDWTAVGAADRTLLAALSRWPAAGALTSVEQVALARLRQSHQAALDQCMRCADALALRLQDMNTRKDGWLAYAATGTWEDLPA